MHPVVMTVLKVRINQLFKPTECIMKSLVNTKRVRSHYMVLVMAFLASLVSGCATIEGAGEDIESAGDAVEDAADDAS